MRDFITSLGSIVALCGVSSAASAGIPAPTLPNGLSVGDATPTAAVIWARASAATSVTFEWSLDPSFALLAGAVTVEQKDPLVPAKAIADGLLPWTVYHVRATLPGGAACTGAFRTPAAADERRGLRFGASGDWRGELSPYPAIANADERGLDFFIKLGDTIYADYPSPAVPAAQCRSLWEYRLKHDEVYSERFGLSAWRDLQATTTVLATIDDHEVTNDFQGGASPGGDPQFSTAVAAVETPIAVDSKEGGFADSDDPSIWVHPIDPKLSVVVATKKNGGLSVFDLDGVVLQEISPPDIRYNNVDLVEAFELSGVATDLFVVSDRLNDLVVVYAIDPASRALTDVTDRAMGRVFPDVDVKEQETAYGVGCYTDPVDGTAYAFMSRRSRSEVVQLALIDNGGVVGWTKVRTIELPDTFPADGGTWSPEDPQVEGLVVDDELGVVYLGQEQVGIWKVSAAPDSVDAPVLVHRVREFEGDGGGGDSISADVEGLAIYPTGPGTGWLLASSQGDDTFAVYTREGANSFVGSFTIGGVGTVDGVEECDGADIVATPVGTAYPKRLLVVQDGNALPAVIVEDDGEFENGATNFKLVSWETVEQAIFEKLEHVNQTPLYGAGLQTFQEWNAIEQGTWSGTGDDRFDGRPNLYRASRWGHDAAVFVLDARSFRDAGLPPVSDPSNPFEVAAFITASFDPGRTMLGSAQKAQLLADLSEAQADGVTWKFVVVPEPIQNLGVLAASDRFEGYAAERTEILGFIEDQGIDNVVFVAADIHGTLVNNLTYQLAPFGPQIPTAMFEITTGSVAFDAPFGPTVAEIGAGLGLLSPAQYAFYLSLPPQAQDAVVESLVNATIQPLGYDLLGLQDSPVDATLLAGAYSAVHWFGWTEFEIDDLTQDLTVTTWGIAPYSEAQLLADPAEVVARTPRLVNRFVIAASGVSLCAGDLDGDGQVGSADFGGLIANWGGAGSADLNGDGIVDGADLGALLGAWGPCGE